MGYTTTELQPFVPTDYMDAIYEETYVSFVDHCYTAHGTLPTLPMCYTLAKHEDIRILNVLQLIADSWTLQRPTCLSLC